MLTSEYHYNLIQTHGKNFVVVVTLAKKTNNINIIIIIIIKLVVNIIDIILILLIDLLRYLDMYNHNIYYIYTHTHHISFLHYYLQKKKKDITIYTS